tara:strand:+ start:531 stop:782 length:252 start_codon:yes stop_codon:yes gene_type:complete
MIKLFNLIFGAPKKQEFPLRPGSVNEDLRALYKPRQAYEDSVQTFQDSQQKPQSPMENRPDSVIGYQDSNMVFQEAMDEFLSS